MLNALILQEAADGIAEAFVGGTVGVMSVALYLELKKLNEKNLEACPYCVGNGEILCGGCLGSGVTAGSSICSMCGGRGLVMCINCKGDGRETPILLVSKAVRNPVSEATKVTAYIIDYSSLFRQLQPINSLALVGVLDL